MFTNDQEISITLFAASSEEGERFAQLLKQALSNLIIAGRSMHFETVKDANQTELGAAILREDVVIFDGSVEDDIGSNYKAANNLLYAVDHVLVVSRTRLPLNFQPCVLGGSPDTFTATSASPFTLSNDELVDWIITQIRAMESRLPRPQNERMQEFSALQFGKIMALEMTLLSNSMRRQSENQRNSNRCFVSYLSRYSRHHHSPIHFGTGYVEDVIEHVCKSRSISQDNVLYYPPGSLSSEFMTEHRRWQVVSLILDRVQTMDEIWILETDDYYNSWWTLAELAMFSALRGETRMKPRIILLNVSEEGYVETEVGNDFLLSPNMKLAREFTRCISNSDPRTMGREKISNMRRIGNLPKPLQWLQYWVMKPGGDRFMRDMVANMQEIDPNLESKWAWGQFQDEWTWGQFQEMLRSPVNMESFWNDRIVTCPRCVGENKKKNHFDFDKFVYHRQRGQYRVSQEEMEVILHRKYWTCPGIDCHQRYEVVQQANDQFFWWPIRVKFQFPFHAERIMTGPNGVLVERQPVYELR
jgi:hypothetical protein